MLDDGDDGGHVIRRLAFECQVNRIARIEIRLWLSKTSRSATLSAKSRRWSFRSGRRVAVIHGTR